MQSLTKIIVFLFGLAVGSFLNVCIYRMPRNLSVRKPGRSFCPHCKKLIPWYDNIPLVSFIILRARCRFCKNKISLRYFIVELTTAIIFLILFNIFGLSGKFLIYLLFCGGLIAASFIDIEHQIIPDEISVGGLVVGVILSFIFPFLHNAPSHILSLWRSVLGMVIGGGIIYLTAVIGDFIFKKESMGGGDIKLLAMIGAFLGWKSALVIFIIAPILGAIVSVGLNLNNLIILYIKKEQDKIIKGDFPQRIKTIFSILFTGVIPYGPFISFAAFIVLINPNLMDGIISLFTISY